MKNWFNELNAIDVGEHIEKKNGLSYLSWMWAWTELKKRYPLSYSTVHESPEGLLVWRDPIGCHVKTSVTIVWEEEDGLHEHTVTEYLPVMDFKNKAIPLKYKDGIIEDGPDAMAINKTIQRSLTKCIARLGVGGYVYAGEDMPEESEDVKAAKEEEKKAAENTKALIAKELSRIATKLTEEDKKSFSAKYIKPVVGTSSYKTCTDANKLNELYEKLKEM